MASVSSAEGGTTNLGREPITASRSAYYAALAYAGYATGGLWLTVVVQALAAGWLLYLLLIRVWRLGWPYLVLASVALMSLTPLGVYTSFLMPDVFAALAILAVAVLGAYWPRLTNVERGLLAVLLWFSLVAHSSHFAAMMVLIPGLAWVAYRAGWPHWRRRAALLASCMLLAWMADWGFKQAVVVYTGMPPVRLPHLTARLIDLGPGTRFLKANCPQVGYAACAYVANYPTEWKDFLFSPEPQKGAWTLSDPELKRRISTEQVALAIDVLRSDPVAVVKGLSMDAFRQVARFRVNNWGYDASHFSFYQTRLPPEILDTFNHTRAVQSPSLNPWLSAATYTTTLLALAYLVWQWRTRRSSAGAAGDGRSADWTFTSIVLMGVLANAIICGALASPYDRFQARVIWLVPLVALAVAPRRPAQPSTAPLLKL